MGVTGLLGLLKSIQHPGDLKRYSGKTLGVDTYGWLHKGAISCASQLAQGIPTKRYVDYCMFRVRMLIHNGVTPYLVFDGDFLPSKAGTEASRAAKREESRQRGLEFLKAGKHKQADEQFQKCIDITPAMARAVMDEARSLGVKCVVAPYEADSQLVYMEKMGIIHGILSEDSDMLVFGATRLITKLDRYGSCIEVNRLEFCRVREVSLTGWSDAEFRQMCILSGCDYLPSIGGIGLKSAYRLLRKHKTAEKVVKMLQFEGKSKVSENYMTEFVKAELTFLHQRVFCPIKKEMVMLTPDESGAVDGMPFIGAYVEPELCRKIAAGEIDPITKLPLGNGPVPPSPRKRRMSSGSETTSVPPQGNPRHSISSFFSRHPMGEMDRNCFNVDPEKVAHITNHGLAPRVFPIPRPYIPSGSSTPTRGSPRRRRKTEPVQNLLNTVGFGDVSPQTEETPTRSMSAPMRRAGRHSIGPTGIGISSQYRPKKKARLCDDLPEEDEFTEVPVPQKSKYFSPSTPQTIGMTTQEVLLQQTPPIPPVFSKDQTSDGTMVIECTPKKQDVPNPSPVRSVRDSKNTTLNDVESLPDINAWQTPRKHRRNSSRFKVVFFVSWFIEIPPLSKMSATMRNAVARRPHRERAQPLERKKLGLLEKKKDYTLRAKDFNKKKKELANLRAKAAIRNEDEFYFGMLSRSGPGSKLSRGKSFTGTVDGDRGNKVLDMEMARLLKTQDVAYVRSVRTHFAKEVERVRQQVILLQGSGVTKKIIFAENDAERGFLMGDVDEEAEEDDDDDMLPAGFDPMDMSAFDDMSDDYQESGSDEEEEKPKETPAKKTKEEYAQRERERKLERTKNRLADMEKKLRMLSRAEQQMGEQRAKMAKTATSGGVTKKGHKKIVKTRKR